MHMIKTIIGGVLYFGGMVVALWGLYVLVSTVLGFNEGISFVGAIAGIGFIAFCFGIISYGIGKFLLK